MAKKLVEEPKRMTVGELIQRLNKVDPDLPVRTISYMNNPLDESYRVIDVYQISGSDEEHFNACFIVGD